MKKISKLYILVSLLFVISYSCNKDHSSPAVYKTKNVIIVVVDGARYSETWGDTTFANIPNMHEKLAAFGCINTNFFNNGPTYTLAGHTAICTGFYQEINNSGNDDPLYPSLFQAWNNKFKNDSTHSWIISSKDKLQVLANCNQNWWTNKYKPSTNCGIDGLGVGSGYRNDSLTFNESLRILNENHPNLVLLSFREPDYSAHLKNWNAYLKGIVNTDEYIYQLWNFIQNDSIYRGTTTLFVTNDHGRHLDDVADGFVSHGDGCQGCKHIFLFASGPDFQQGIILDKKRELIDIPATIEVLLNFEVPNGHGHAMTELFK